MNKIVEGIVALAGIVFLKKAFDEEMQNPESRKAVDDAKAKVKGFFSTKKTDEVKA